MARDSFQHVISDRRAEAAAQFMLAHPLSDNPLLARRTVAAFCAELQVATNLWEPYRARGLHWCDAHGIPVPATWLRTGNRLPVIARESWKDRTARTPDYLAA